MNIVKLPEQTAAATGYNWSITLTHEDLTETTANTAQTFEALTVKAGSLVKDAAIYLVTPFKDASDTGFNSNTVTVGDGSDVDRFIAATQVNENGTEVDAKGSANTTPYAYTGADTIDIVVNSMSAKSLSDIDTGELRVLLNLVELSSL